MQIDDQIVPPSRMKPEDRPVVYRGQSMTLGQAVNMAGNKVTAKMAWERISRWNVGIARAVEMKVRRKGPVGRGYRPAAFCGRTGR